MEGYLRDTREFLHLDCAEGKLAALPVDSASGQDLENVEAAGGAAIGMECTVLNHGETIMPASGKCYELTFDSNRWETTFPIDASSTSAIAFFAQHLPTEFEDDSHYLKLVSTGEDIEPVAEEMGGHDDDDEEASRPWVKALGAALLINLVTLAGLIFAIPFIASALKKADPIFVYAGFASFAAGAILSCAFFLLLFESTHLIAEGWDEETDHIWRWGTMILLGLILPVIVESIVGHVKPDDSDSKADVSDKFSDEYKAGKADIEASGTDSDSAGANMSPFAAKTFSEKVRLIFSICFGDFMHNLCDGFFVGAAFNECSDSMAWGITIATILHEYTSCSRYYFSR